MGEYIEAPKNKVVKNFWSQQAYRHSSFDDMNCNRWIKETL